MSSVSHGLKSIAVQADFKCRHCAKTIQNPLYAEVAIQTEWSLIDVSSQHWNKNVNTVVDFDDGYVATLSQVVSDRDNRQFHTSCNSHPCNSCLNCKYVCNHTDGSMDQLFINELDLQKKLCPSLPEPANFSIDYIHSSSRARCFKNGRKKNSKAWLRKTDSRNSKIPDIDQGNCTPNLQDLSSIQDQTVKDSNALRYYPNDEMGVYKNQGQRNDEESDFEPLPESSIEVFESSDTNLPLSEETVKKKKNLKRKMLMKSKGSVRKRRLMQKSNYVSAGLYSDCFKCLSENPGVDPKGPSKVFPKPIHYGKHLLRLEEDFVLPYDVWISRNSRKKPTNPSLIYKKIRNNIYVDVRPVCKDSEPSQCNCRPPDDPTEEGCTDNCLNRMVYTECVPNLCACGDSCGNQRIQKHQAFRGLREFLTEDRGYGVQALEPIAAGQFVMEYVGEVVSEQEFRRRMTDLYSGMEHHYCLSLDGGTVIDGYRCGNVSRLINHSCSPNCEMQKWNVNGVPRIGLFALKDIGVDEELTYDYNFHAYNTNAQQECKCGSENCRKVVGGRGQKEGQGSEKPRIAKVGFTMHCNRSKTNHTSSQLQQYASSSGYCGLPTIRERKLIRRKLLLLMRNLDRARRSAGLRESATEKEGTAREEDSALEAEVFKTQFTAINTSRSVRTRRLTKAEDNDTILRMSFLAQVFMKVFNDVINCKDEFGNVSLKPLAMYNLPSKKKFPMLYGMVPDPVDLSTIEGNISSGRYSTSLSFHEDFMKFFSTAEKVSSDGASLELMKSQYFDSMENARSFLETIGDVLPKDLKSLPPSPLASSSLLSSPLPSSPLLSSPLPSSPLPSSPLLSSPPPCSPFVPTMVPSPVSLASTSVSSSYRPLSPTSDGEQRFHLGGVFQFESGKGEGEDDDIISCVCGLYLDEGVMIQCENCQTWQHQSCMKADVNEEDYLCHLCGPRKVNKEVLLTVQPRDGELDCHYYMTLMRGDLQLRVGESVYVLDEEDLVTFLTPSSESSSSLEKFSEVQLMEAYKVLLADVDKLDLFRIDNLWIDGSGRRLMHGHYFLRPREIYHDSGQKFFEKEVLKAPSIFVTLPVACAVAPCCVMDVASYSLGRPRDFSERDVYVCEYRVDKNWRTVKRSLKFNHPANKSGFCFNRFVGKVVFKRNYVPHGGSTKGCKTAISVGDKTRRKPSEKPDDPRVPDGLNGAMDESTVGVDEDVGSEQTSNARRPRVVRDLESKRQNLESVVSRIRELERSVEMS